MRQIPHATLIAIERHFHALIRGRTAGLADLEELVLPELGRLVAGAEREGPDGWEGWDGWEGSSGPERWFPVPGMFGGFRYWLEGEGEQTKLVTESWCRAVEGSGQRHEITAQGSVLTAAGFC